MHLAVCCIWSCCFLNEKKKHHVLDGCHVLWRAGDPATRCMMELTDRLPNLNLHKHNSLST